MLRNCGRNVSQNILRGEADVREKDTEVQRVRGRWEEEEEDPELTSSHGHTEATTLSAQLTPNTT